MPNWYTLKTPLAAAASSAVQGEPAAAAPEVLIYQDIGDSWWSEDPITAAKFRDDLQAINASDITVRILSGGGSVHDGLAIYNALKAHPARITTINDGWCASIASLIFMAGDVRVAAANSVLMVHAPWTYAEGNADSLRKTADVLDAWARAMATSYAEATGRTQADMLALLTDGIDHYYTADEAVAQGFATQVGDASPMAAQASAHITRALAAMAQRKPQVSPPAAQQPAAQPQEPVQMPNATQTPQVDAADIQARAREEGAKAEAARRAAIEASFKPFAHVAGIAEVQAAALQDMAVTAEKADSLILAHIGKQQSSAAAGRVETVQDEADKFRAAGTQAIMARAGAKDETGKRVVLDTANPLRGLSLLEVARASLARAGVSTLGMGPMEVVAAAFTQSTGDFTILLENVLNKTMLGAYATAPDTWSQFCRIGSVGDFRANPRYRTGSIGNLDSLTELGEFRSKAIPDGDKASITIGTRGNIINLSRIAIVNDDMGAFMGLANDLGRAAKRTIEQAVYDLLASNGGAGPTMQDGVALFHASHGNLAASGAAPTVVTVEAGRVAMARQKDISGNDFLALTPAIGLCGTENGSTMRILNSAQYDPDTANRLQRPNAVNGLLANVVDTPRLTTPWYLFSNPADVAALEVAFLNGQDMPVLEQQTGWTVDGTAWKARLDFGVAAIDWRAAYRNPGA